MTPEALRAREALFLDIAAGRPVEPARVAAVARLLGVTAAAVLLDLLVEAKGVA